MQEQKSLKYDFVLFILGIIEIIAGGISQFPSLLHIPGCPALRGTGNFRIFGFRGTCAVSVSFRIRALVLHPEKVRL